MSKIVELANTAYQWMMAHPKTSLLIVAGIALAAIVLR